MEDSGLRYKDTFSLFLNSRPLKYYFGTLEDLFAHCLTAKLYITPFAKEVLPVERRKRSPDATGRLSVISAAAAAP